MSLVRIIWIFHVYIANRQLAALYKFEKSPRDQALKWTSLFNVDPHFSNLSRIFKQSNFINYTHCIFNSLAVLFVYRWIPRFRLWWRFHLISSFDGICCLPSNFTLEITTNNPDNLFQCYDDHLERQKTCGRMLLLHYCRYFIIKLTFRLLCTIPEFSTTNCFFSVVSRMCAIVLKIDPDLFI